MKKTFVPLMLLASIALLPLACYNYLPYGPSEQGGRYRPPSTPVANPTYATPAPTFVTSWGTAGGPNALAFGMATTVYVAEADDNNFAMVEVFDSSNPSAPITQWTAYGSTPFNWPGGVAVNPYTNNVYVADNVNNAVYEFTSAGATVASWTGYGGAAFNAPEGIAFSSATTTLYVADTGNNEVEEFDANGNPLHEWNGGGGNNFYQPSAIAIDGTGDVYVADAGNVRVLEFNSGGTSLLNTIPMVNYADIFGIAVDGSGHIYAADYGDGTQYNGNGLMEEYDSSGHVLAVWGSSQGSYAFGPDGVALSGSNIYVADYNNDLIQVF
jgi:DNA-binding beta-propeller fold protein YncE